MRPRTRAAAFLPVALLVLVVVVASLPSRGDVPVVTESPDASRTVTWTFNTSERLVLQDVELVGGRAVLPWRPVSLDWPSAPSFVANGTLDSNLTSPGVGLELVHDPRNHIDDGDFSSSDAWTMTDGPMGFVTARWDSAAGTALLGHNSPTTEVVWETFDSIADWSWSAPPGTFGGIDVSTTEARQGGAMEMAIEITGSATWGSAVHGGTVDWSSGSLLLVWVKPMDTSSPLSFNVTATVAGAFRTTPGVSLVQGWQELRIDLSPLGTASDRASLEDLRFRINGQNVPPTRLYFDDARLASRKTFIDFATVDQQLEKANETTPFPGSARLSFDWLLVNSSGILAKEALVRLSGPAGTVEFSFAGPAGAWTTFQEDVSSGTAPPGTYTLSFLFLVFVDNTTESHANLRIDNVSLRFPNRRDGAYLSNPIPLGRASEFLNLSWSATVPPETSVTLSLRSGNGSDPTDASWSPWRSWSTPGTHPPLLPGADHVQVRAYLNTTNASRSPVLESLRVDTRHRAPSGVMTASVFRAAPGFLRWRSLSASIGGTPSTSIDFSAGNGSFLSPVPADGNLSAFPDRDFQWRAVLTTVDGLATPSLSRVDAVYEFLGPVDRIVTNPSGLVTLLEGETVSFQATALDAGNHVVPLPPGSFQWSTDDPDGEIRNDGTYTAGRKGNYSVTVTVIGSGKFATVPIRVLERAGPPPEGPSILATVLPLTLVAFVIAGASFAGYQYAVRRMFAIDDVFLISRDGRLILHNTRRMRADRDEDILSGMLTAILAFIRDWDREENGEARRFDIGGKTTLLAHGRHMFVAATYSGRVPRWAARDLRRFVQDLELHFGDRFARWSGAREDLPGLRKFTDRLVTRVRYRPGRNGRRPA